MIIIDLSRNVIKRYIAVSSPQKITSSSNTVYGTVVNDGKFVQIDGSNILTPVSSTIDLKDGDRVLVLLKNHEATVIGSPTAPTARLEELRALETGVNEFEVILADKVGTGELVAMQALIEELEAKDVTISGQLAANKAKIDTLEAENATINGKLDVYQADIEELQADTAKIDTIEAQNVEINEQLTAVSGKIDNFESAYADIENVVADNVDIKQRLTAAEADIVEINTSMLTAESADIRYANIDFSNIGDAAIESFFSKSGMIEDLVVDNGTIAGELVGVTIKGDLIEGGTVKADKLVVQGSDGLYYKLNTDGVTVETEQTEYNSLDGSVITAKSITATKIAVEDLVAFGATIGGFKITNSSLYSGVKESVDNTTTGVYMDDSGQMAIGDGLNFLKYYYDEAEDKYKLEISADNITMGSKSLSISKTVSGDIVHIEDAAPDTKLLGIGVEGKYEQAGTPSPETPQHINTVGGNLFDVNFIQGAYQYYYGEFVSSYQHIVCTEKIPVRGGSTVTFSSDYPSKRIVFTAWTESGTYATPAEFNDVSQASYTIPSSCSYVVIHVSCTDGGSSNNGNTTVTPEEITNARLFVTPTLEVMGKNLFPNFLTAETTTAGVTFTPNADGSVTAKGTATAWAGVYSVVSMKETPLEAGQTYVLHDGVAMKENTSCTSYLQLRDADGNLLVNAHAADFVLTVPEETTLVTFGVNINNGTTVDATFYPQLELGSTATDFQSYQGTTTTLDLDGNELAALPDGTKDELTVDSVGNVTLVKRVGMVVLDGDETFDMSNVSGDDARFNWRDDSIAINTGERSDVSVSDRFPSFYEASYETSHILVSSSGHLISFFLNMGITTLEDWLAWLSANPVTVYYALATEQTISLGKIDMPVLPNEVDTLWIDANISAPLKVKYLTEAGSAVADAISVADAAQYTADIAQNSADVVAYNLANLQVDIDSINASVESVEKTTTERLDGIGEDISTLTNAVNAVITSEDVQIQINESIANHTVGSVTTSTGFTFDADGLTVSKSGSEMTTNIDEDGMTVYRNSEEVLIADNEGVKAEDLHATTFLIIGTNSRFQDYTRDSQARTACFWIG